MGQGRPGRRDTLGGAAALMLVAFFVGAALMTDRRWSGWWVGLAVLFLVVIIRDLAKRKPRPPGEAGAG